MSSVKIDLNMKTLRVRVPKGRDPFVNARLISLGCDARGRERFWISSCNGVSGSTGVTIDEDGTFRLYHLNKPLITYCYSAAPENENTLWLCVGLAQVARLNRKTGAYTLYPTGSEPAFVCCGGQLDPATGKFFALGYLDRGGADGTTAVSFDVKSKKAVVHRDVAPDQFMYSCHRNPDGTYTGLAVCPGASLIHWDPRAETVKSIRTSEENPLHDGHPLFITDAQGRAYFSDRGWYSVQNGTIDPDGPKPEREATWFERRGNLAIGCEKDTSGNSAVYVWDMDTGKVRHVTTIPACYAQGITVARSGKLISMNIYGEFRRHDLTTGRLELFRRLPSEAVQPVDHILRLSRDRLIGSNFITQRFWDINLKTGKGFDCGKAAPGGGQVQHFWKIGGKVFLTSYTTANLLEYDPSRHPNFPENPHVVAEPPESMRPVSFADDGRYLFYASTAHYGKLGCTVTRYDTRTGQYIFNSHPVKDQHICSLWLDARRPVLLAHTSFRADCDSCPPTTDITYHLLLNSRDLSVLNAIPLPNSIHSSGIIGPMDHDRLLCKYEAIVGDKPRKNYLAIIDREKFLPPAITELREPPPDMWTTPESMWITQILYAGRPGRFVLMRDHAVELWDLRRWQCLKRFRKDAQVRGIKVQGHSLYMVRPRDILILDDVL